MPRPANPALSLGARGPRVYPTAMGEGPPQKASTRQAAARGLHQARIDDAALQTLDLPDDILRRAKIEAVERGSTMRQLVIDALQRASIDG